MLDSLAAALLAYGGLCALVYIRQDSMIFFPSREVRVTPADYNIPYEDLSLVTQDGLTIHGWAEVVDPGAPWLVHCHGNGGNVAGRIVYLQLFRSLGFNGVVFDYRGYGKSQGKPSERGLVLDAEAVWNELTGERSVAPGHIVLYGESLGGGVAAALAERHPPGGLVLASTFTSVPDRAAELYPFLPIRMLSRTRLDTLSRVKTLTCPKLIMASRQDQIIPYRHGRRLFEAAAEPKEWFELTGDHNAGPPSGEPEFRDCLRNFVMQASR